VNCPGCAGPKSARATLCRDCRRRANSVGAAVVAQLPTVAAPSRPADVGPRSAGQNRAYHGKCGTLAAIRETTPQQIKAQALEYASVRFGRAITSSGDLDELEMSDVLDWLDTQLA